MLGDRVWIPVGVSVHRRCLELTSGLFQHLPHQTDVGFPHYVIKTGLTNLNETVVIL